MKLIFVYYFNKASFSQSHTKSILAYWETCLRSGAILLLSSDNLYANCFNSSEAFLRFALIGEEKSKFPVKKMVLSWVSQKLTLLQGLFWIFPKLKRIIFQNVPNYSMVVLSNIKIYVALQFLVKDDSKINWTENIMWSTYSVIVISLTCFLDKMFHLV